MVRLRPMQRDDLALVLEWRNREDVRKAMYTQHVISAEEHARWFERASDDPTRRQFMALADDGAVVGVVAFTEIDAVHRRASWAFYAGGSSRPGIGSQMELAALEYAFGELDLGKLWCEVLSSNPRVIAMHRKFGFLVEGTFRQHFELEGTLVDVVRLAMFRTHWEKDLHAAARAIAARQAERGALSPGASHVTRRRVTPEVVEQFAALSGDRNPIHFDAAAARAAGFGAPIAPGMLLGAFLSSVFGVDWPGPGTVYVRQDLRFLQPVAVGEELEVRLEVLTRIGRRVIINTSIRRASDATVVANGEAELLAPVVASVAQGVV